MGQVEKSRFHYRRVTDFVHGTFGISELESDIISTPAFQRLHNVRQLGLAHLVYPGAGYSRFSHSIGACHVAGRMVRAINQNCGTIYDAEDIQLYRLAGLIHDLGHYPFSHTTEHVVGNYYQNLLVRSQDIAGDSVKEALPDGPVSYDHENLGRAILENDPDLGSVLEKHKYSREEIRSVFSREVPGKLSNLVSSDLDCDRLDYLLRTARAAGLPYGEVDVEYITSQTCVDSKGRLCLSPKALRAADHLLVSRYFDYSQVVYHKSVVGLELALGRALKDVLDEQLIDFSGAALRERIQRGNISEVDDSFVVGRLRQLAHQHVKTNSPVEIRIKAVLERQSPRLLASKQWIAERGQSKDHKAWVTQLQKKVDEWAGRFGIDSSLWYIWHKSLSLTKIGSRLSLSEARDPVFEEEAEQAVRILEPNNDSKPLIDYPFALMNTLANYKLYAIRVYAHVEEPLSVQIAKALHADFPGLFD